MTRKYSSTSVATTLAAGINSTTTSITVATGTGSSLMGGVTLAGGNVDQFTIALDVDTINEEILFVTAISSDTLTVVRARAGTTGIAHTAGASVKHVLTSDDLTFYTTGVATADNAVPESVVTAKGDVLVASASGVVDNLAVGSNDQVLTADSTQTLGVKWAAPSIFSLPSQAGNAGEYLQTDGTNPSWQPAVSTLNVTLNAQTGTTYTLVAGDATKLVTLSNAGAITLTIPSGIFTTGQYINIQQIGVGQVTVANNGTSSFTGTGTKLRAQYSAGSIICTNGASNTFTLIGDLV